ncbi:periplasmic heavy metal sensor [Parachitinimonas caeni]|uniref:Periplasmic heavy metal sensor n=1 Tax=Parachitinimonas caeni TaxID=3031301 RepID=A0ABT7E182_9NEIS|nr:periplasmic heavy metal sensor [Parachitinimonas caeni]MDK2124662.1 periplasmic heavy metal sensor [Parachitinimonas caeni]
MKAVTLITSFALTLSVLASGIAYSAPDHESNAAGHFRISTLQSQLKAAHDELKLSAAQEALWQDAEKSSKANRQGMQERMKLVHEQIQTEKSKDILDLQKISDLMDQNMAAAQAAHKDGREKWLKLYASLSADQKVIASRYIKQGMSRMERMRMHGMHVR